MLSCRNKLFNRFLLVSFIFFILSITINILVFFTAVTLPENKARAMETTSKIHVQQEVILERLSRVERQMKKKNQRRRSKKRVK